MKRVRLTKEIVAPFVGAWIEMFDIMIDNVHKMSLRSSERGLKFYIGIKNDFCQYVAPFVGAWIEIPSL